MIKKEISLSAQANGWNAGSLGEVRGLKKKCFYLILFFGCYLLSASFIFSLDPHKHVTQYMHRAWGLRQGLPQSTVHAIARTRDGYLWLGTQEGLARFDGEYFEVFNRQNVPQLKSNWIITLYQDHADRLWLGTYGGGLTCLDEGSFTTYTTKDGLPGNDIRAIHEDRAGNLWIGTDGSGLSRLKDGKFTHYTSKQGLAHDRVFAVLEDRAGNLWVGTGGGLNRLINGEFTRYTTKEGLAHDEVYALYEDRSGSLWVGTRGGLNRLTDGDFTTYTTAQGLSHNQVLCIYEDRDGNLWIGTRGGGLNRLFNGVFTPFTGKQGLGSNTVCSLYEDPEGGLWVGADGGGLSRLRDGLFTPYTKAISRGGLSNDIVFPIYEDRSGSLWFGTEGGGLSHLEDGVFTTYTSKQGLADDTVWALYEEPGGSMWIGTNGGLNRLRDGVFTTFTTEEGLCHNTVWCILRDSRDSLWIGTNDGLSRLKEGTFTSYTTKQGLCHNTIFCLHKDSGGSLWIGTGDGLNRLKDNTFTSYTQKEGLSHNWITCFHEDSDGSLWIGTFDGGLNRFKEGNFNAVTSAGGLFDNRIHTILEDKLGNLWMSCNKGVFRVSKKEVEDFFQGRRKGITCIVYDERHGMKSRECNGSCQPSSCRARDGSLWFPTIEGAVKIDPGNIKTNTVAPPLVIETLVADNNEFYMYVGGTKEKPGKEDKTTLPAGTKRIEIHYTALSFTDPDAVRFKYQLEGYDSQWSDVVGERYVVYTNLSPGNYTFRVKGCNNEGLWNETPTALSFYLTPFFYQTPWFYTLSVLFLVFLLYNLYNLRVRQLKRREKNLQLQVDERTKELHEAKNAAELANRKKSDYLANLSHEIRTPMNAILGFSDIMKSEIDDPQYKEYLEAIAAGGKTLLDLINDVLDYSRIEAGKMELQYEPVDPSSLLKEIKYIFSNKIKKESLQLHLEIAPDVPQRLRLDSLRLRQVLTNLVGNAVKFTHRGFVKVAITKSNSTTTPGTVNLILSVQDSGIGIPPDQQDKIFYAFSQREGQLAKKYGGTGLGLAITRSLVQMMGGKISVESTEGEGSTFRILLPAVTVVKRLLEDDDDFRPDLASVRFDKNTILVVDDHSINRRLLAGYLAKQDVDIIEGENGREAVDLAERHRPALVLMDLQMPEMDGYEALRIMKADDQLKKIPVIIVTASFLNEVIAKTKREGADGFLGKPVGKEDLFITLMHFLPYSTVEAEVTGDNGDAAPQEEKLTSGPLAPGQLEKLHRLIEILQTDSKPRWKKISKRFLLKEIEAFAAECLALGNEYGVLSLKNWGDRLLREKREFDMLKVRVTLETFPRLLQELETWAAAAGDKAL